ncbi:hypothetical protein FQZ95_06445 [Escherichia sp. HH41S]|nr:hypothetical protein [Escherichia coli]MXE42235.1 hypothetical protein [Escherichia sp. HH41S]
MHEYRQVINKTNGCKVREQPYPLINSTENIKLTNVDATNKKTSLGLPTLEQVYALLKANYKPARFADRDGEIWGHEYSWNLARSSLQDLEKYGKSYVSKHADRMGDGFSFGPDLVIIR